MFLTSGNIGPGGESVNRWRGIYLVEIKVPRWNLEGNGNREDQCFHDGSNHQRFDVHYMMEGSCALAVTVHLVRMFWNEMMVQDDTPPTPFESKGNPSRDSSTW